MTKIFHSVDYLVRITLLFLSCFKILAYSILFHLISIGLVIESKKAIGGESSFQRQFDEVVGAGKGKPIRIEPHRGLYIKSSETPQTLSFMKFVTLSFSNPNPTTMNPPQVNPNPSRYSHLSLSLAEFGF